MDLTIKNIPTQAVADRIKHLSANVVAQYLERDKRQLTQPEKEELDIAKEQFRRDNGLSVK